MPTLKPHKFFENGRTYYIKLPDVCEGLSYTIGKAYGLSKVTSDAASEDEDGEGISVSEGLLTEKLVRIRLSYISNQDLYIDLDATAYYDQDEDREKRYTKAVENNICMVWDDVDSSVFSNSPDLYRLFKFGSNKATDKIILSSKEIGENLEFRCFSPKIFIPFLKNS